MRLLPGRHLSQPQGVGNDRDRTQAHGQGRDHRAEQQPEYRIQHAGSNRHAQCVVGKRKTQVLLHVGDGFIGDRPGLYDAGQIPLDQGDLRAGHGHIGAGAHRNTDVGRSQGRGIIDPIACHGDPSALGLELVDQLHLVLRPDLAVDFVNAQGMPDRVSGSLGITRSHHDAQSVGSQGFQGLQGGVLDPVSHGHGASQAPIHAQVHDARPLFAQAFGSACHRRDIRAYAGHERLVAKRHRAAFDVALHALPGDRIELLGGNQRLAALPGLFQDGLGQWVFAALLQAGRPAQDLVFAEVVGREDLPIGRAAFGERAGLVDDQGIDLAQLLDRLGITKQHAHLRGPAGRHHDRHGRGQAQRTRAGDDQHRDRIEDRVCPGWLGAEHAPDQKSQHRYTEHGEHEPERDLVGHALHGRA